MNRVQRILIANRGEIVVRVARTARRLGVPTVAVHSDADAANPHVAACDDAVALGGNAAADSYLHADKLLAAARIAGADSIHPGYGFLSENAAFAEAVAAAGLTFIGPPAAAIAAMGDKARARQRMAAAGIPVVPGYDGDAQDEATLVEHAGRIGYPIMVKAAAGGGGRGMRLVTAAAELPDALRAAASEATKAFGDGRLILERAIVEPRHVEIQVLADAHGHVIHLGERDCSVQRRHQKVVEEAPSPAVDAGLRARMGATAVAVAREIGYVGAGTVEFLLDRAGHFYFMEMNTRLQVEHPVTELVTGLDLVEWQIRIARGEPLPLQQADVQLRGHAVEVRLCAESPADEFLPGSGPVIDWSAPAGVRCDHALARGSSVPAWYDSMVAKVVAHAASREDALAQLADALDRTVLLGVPSNRAFLARVLRHPAFVAGVDVSTAFIGHHFPTPGSRAEEPDARTWALAAWLSVAASPEALATPRGWRHWTTGRALPRPWRLRRAGSHEQDEQHGRVLVEGMQGTVEAAASRHEVTTLDVAPGIDARAVIDGTTLDYRYAWDGDTLWLHTRAADFAFTSRRREPLRSAAAEGGRATDVRSTINARVLQVAVTVGAEVARGERLVVLEAMKMEHEVRAARPGRIAELGVKPGDQVVPGQRLVRFEGDT
ncbi:MAG TPA: biotin carboxylase N-terminal domain-containing protein [Steroidobacteraceae bacterium]